MEVTAHTPAMVTLRYVVMNLLNELREDDKDYKPLLQLAIDGFSELNIFHISNVRVKYLTISEIESGTAQYYVDMPDDMIDYFKIGVNSGGRLLTLTKKDELVLPRAETCGVGNSVPDSENIDLDISNYGWYFTDHFYGTKYVPYLYGVTGGTNFAYYRVDYEQRKIFISGDISDGEIILEYKTSGVSLSDDTLIPRQALGCVKAYVHWKRLEYDPRIPMNDKMRKESLYGKEIEQLRAHELTPTLEEYMDSLYSSYKQTVKR